MTLCVLCGPLQNDLRGFARKANKRGFMLQSEKVRVEALRARMERCAALHDAENYAHRGGVATHAANQS